MARKSVYSTLGLAFLAAVTASCGEAGVAPSPLAPVVRADVMESEFTKLPAPPHGAAAVSAVIGKLGGYLMARASNGHPFGYLLIVPKGTVKKNTLFTMEVPAGSTYDVELHANQNGVDIGRSLKQHVLLGISFADAPPGLTPHDLSQVKIYYLPDGDEAESVPSYVSTDGLYVMGVLSHFSRYSVGFE